MLLKRPAMQLGTSSVSRREADISYTSHGPIVVPATLWGNPRLTTPLPLFCARARCLAVEPETALSFEDVVERASAPGGLGFTLLRDPMDGMEV